MSPSDGTGRPAPSDEAVGAAGVVLHRLEALRSVAPRVKSAVREALTAAYAADAGLVSRAEHERVVAEAADHARWLAALNAKTRGEIVAERDELRARLTVVEAERAAARESVAELSSEFLHAAKISSTVRHARKVVAAMGEQFPSLLVRADAAEAALAACREQNTVLREALEAIRAYAVADEPHYDAHRWTTCGEGPCLACLIHSTAETALASVRPAGSTDNENGDEER